MDRWEGRVALVTGASAGIGLEVSKQLVEKGMTVIGVARNIDKIQEMAKTLTGPGKLVGVECDIRQEEKILSVFEHIKVNYGGVDVCINNAGLAHQAPLLTGATSDWREMLEVNVLGATIIGREFMKDVRRRNVDDGHLIYLNSLSGHRVPLTSFPGKGFYAATKFAVSALVEGTRQELREIKSNCRVTSISPGMVRTEFHGRLNKLEDIEESKKMYDSLFYNGQVLESEDIASAVLFVLSAPQRMEINDIVIRPTAQVN